MTPKAFFCGVIFLICIWTQSTWSQIETGFGSSVPTFVITAPKYARYDVATTFSVSATNVGRTETIHLLIRTGTASEVTLAETTLSFTSNGVQTWSVDISSEQMQQRTFQVRAEHRTAVKVMEVNMTPNSGFIMIQTDKTIYTPRQTVMYRIIALDDDQRFADWPITVDIKNPDMIILERQHYSSLDAFTGRNFSLPRDATEGDYIIEAYFTGSKVSTRRSITFVVKEYVLPTFKVDVTAQEKVIVLSTNWLRVYAKAVYSYGQPVQGRAQLRLGVVGSDRITLFDATFSQRLNASGQCTFTIPVAQMKNHSLWFPDGARLYLEANVTEDGTGEVAKGVAMDSYFANPYYRISFKHSKKYFKPGFPYNFVVEVTAANGDPAAGISIWAVGEMRSIDGSFLEGGFGQQLVLDSRGRTTYRFSSPAQTVSMRMQIYTLDPRTTDWSHAELQVSKFTSPSNTYLHLDREGNNILLSYTPPLALSVGPPQLITVLVLTKGRLIHSATVQRDMGGSSIYRIPAEVLIASAPSARVVAYFYTRGFTTELVSDALFLNTEDVCREELSMSHMSHQRPFLPKQETELTLRGGGGMRVGLLAVDKAVYFLRDESSLNREKLFDILGETDDGRHIGDGEDTGKIFEYSGLQYMELTEQLAPVIRPSIEDNFDISRLRPYIPQVRRFEETFSIVQAREASIPLEEVRKYFPESWLFKEITLSADGVAFESITMPDSITTWAFSAVGVGREGGVCMSRPLELVVFKPFFAQVRLPYKAVRLEEVSIEIGIYNHKDFDINVTVTVTGGLGVCFSEGAGGQQRFAYFASLRAKQTTNQALRVIPLVAGSVELTVDVHSTNGRERDIITKTLHVVAEGRRVTKAITFPLDPTGHYSSHQTINRQGVQQSNSATITNHIDGNTSKQMTQINLYMPEEIVQGSERCQISACGDLMGDIINTAVIEGDSLFDSTVVDAEEAVGNLAPAVHALLYLNTSMFMTPEVGVKGRTHVTLGVSRLLSYRKKDGSFALSAANLPATWLTALVLKTLCYAEQVTFIDHDPLIDSGFRWLLDQIRNDGTLSELDRRLAQPSREYDMMLSAETLIALQECVTSRPFLDSDTELMTRLVDLLKSSINDIQSPLVMAKTAYALTLFDPFDPQTVSAIQRLHDMKRITIQGLTYWAVTSENEPIRRPFWYHSGTKASSIEATAYSLLVFAKQAQSHSEEEDSFGEFDSIPTPSFQINLDAIAGWLIQKRNSRGAFIGAMDTAAATQALSVYSISKQGQQEVNLHCNVTTSPSINYTHSFDFSQLDAIRPKTLPNVPVGRQLHVETRGTGLGQMQVRVEYNVPVEANAECRYNVNITRRTVAYYSLGSEENPVCQQCNMGCSDEEEVVDDSIRTGASRGSVVDARGRGHDSGGRRRPTRSITSTKVSICVQVCLSSTTRGGADRTIVDIEMLSGFTPYKEDLQRLIDRRERLNISGLVWIPERSVVEIKFNQIPSNRNRCVSFRALENYHISRRNPAIVRVRAHEDSEANCVHSYDPVVSEENLAVYCSRNSSSNQGQCRCFSGICGTCHTAPVTLGDVQRLVCNSHYVHKVQQINRTLSEDWVDMHFNVLETPKNDGDPVDPQIHLVTPRRCACPHAVSFGTQQPIYFFASEVDVFVDRTNRQSKTYVVDHTTSFIGSNTNGIQNYINISKNMCSN